ncbi:hypothetical protein [Wohlfahrtiimonas chitiniclastica]|uniref:hypothetical protein n=1 Tax=Wohlfahrtiimonas chitiniclastica TaxID=400946 RepID=UPI001BCB6997|nr:hypothetical protein [Wohlfahrtiimonas chitiniclastica]MBS7837400.1 hypothetical protein [Wohlfahrtiimonas chitiniclastica]
MSDIGRLTKKLEEDVSKADVWANGPAGASYTAKDGVEVPTIRTLNEKAVVNIQAAQEAAKDAERAADIVQAAQLNSNIYSSVDSGMLNTKEGDVFLVSRNDGIDSYKNESDKAVLIAEDITSVSKINSVGNKQVKDNSNYSRYQSENIFEIVDRQGRQTWIQVDINGLPSDVSMKALSIKMGASHEAMKNQNNILFAIASLQGIVTDLAVDQRGNFLSNTIDNIGKRLGGRKFMNDIGFVGSSTIWLMHTKEHGYLIQKHFADEGKLALLGNSGAGFEAIATRGGYPSTITFLNDKILIGNNAINCSWAFNKYIDKFDVSLDNGIKGAISYDDGALYFYSEKESDIIQDFPMKITTDTGLFKFVFVNNGKNNLNSASVTAQDVFKMTEDLIQYYIDNDIEYVVMDHFANYNASQSSVEKIMECNRLLRARYGYKFLSIFEMIHSDEMWDFVGTEKSLDDIKALSENKIPPSFQRDNSHMNKKASEFVVTKMLEKYKDMQNDNSN